MLKESGPMRQGYEKLWKRNSGIKQGQQALTFGVKQRGSSGHREQARPACAKSREDEVPVARIRWPGEPQTQGLGSGARAVGGRLHPRSCRHRVRTHSVGVWAAFPAKPWWELSDGGYRAHSTARKCLSWKFEPSSCLVPLAWDLWLHLSSLVQGRESKCPCM